ncbi:LEF-2 [Betabaculovirus altermyunipunctae]|uniref:LEF-2 n=1 Tax=Betabaculovirus altermyunipunctae TaxID=3051996 RepID=A0A1S5YDX1_9BBAC|nr:LEF-2 [Betabaculovirus altermyunipunctae]AQQ80303.1 LEF-2 [Betabaculovirus altermyunipunctae]
MNPSSENEAHQMVREGKLLRYSGGAEVDTSRYYLVDVFARDWSSVVDVYTVFVPGGLQFIVHGLNLRRMLRICPADLVPPPVDGRRNRKKRDLCFLNAIDRGKHAVISIYATQLYNKPTGTSADFKALCERSRNNRYMNRVKFTYRVVKSLQCSTCPGNSCVYDALKLFYDNDIKCEREVDYVVAKDNGGDS